MAVQWLRLHTSTAGGAGFIPGWGTKIPHATCRRQKQKQNKTKKTFFLTAASTFGYSVFLDLLKIYIYIFFKFYLCIYLWLCWVFVSVRGLSLVAANGGHSSSRCAGLSLSRPLLLRSTGSRHAGSVVVAHGSSRSAACGIFPDQGSNPCPLHWQADSQPLRHQGSP